MFEWGYPYAFILLPLPLLISFLWPSAELHLSGALNVPFYEGLALKIKTIVLNQRTKKSLILLSFVWALLIIALANPRFVGAPLPLRDEGYNIMMVLDISGSMAFEDMQDQGQVLSRLDVVKSAASAFVKSRAFDKIGLILFATRAHLFTPLTFDKKNIIDRLYDASIGLAGQSTSIGDATGLAIQRLSKAPLKGRVMILLTDGGNNSGVLDPKQASALAKDAGIRIYTIGLGGQPQAQMGLGGMILGMNPSSNLDEDLLKSMALETGGHYFRATDPSSLTNIYKTINSLEPVAQEDVSRRPQFDYYPWPLAVALILLMCWVIWAGGLLALPSSPQETEKQRP